MTGCERYSTSVGYASSYQFQSDFIDQTKRDQLNRRQTQVIAMDAIPYYNGPADQCTDENSAYKLFHLAKPVVNSRWPQIVPKSNNSIFR